jgi:hypothetical protein
VVQGRSREGIDCGGISRRLHLRPAYIYPVQPRREPTFSFRLLRAIYPAFRLPFPNQVIRADDLARTMVDAAVRDVGAERQAIVLENRDIRALATS